MDHVPALDVDSCSRIDSSLPRDAPALDESLVSSFQVQTKRRRQPVAVHGRPWSVALPCALMAPAANDDGHGADRSRDDSDVGHSSYRDGRRGSAGRQQKRREPMTCGLCHTRETPQWRTGPYGPGTLCNACGIRYRMAGDKYLTEHGHRRFPMMPSFGRERDVQ